MKFRIRFADQIVGIFIIAALVSLVLVIFMLGKAQRWFADDEVFHTQLGAANGLSKNMPIQFRGFVIGSVESFALNENNLVDVEFIIHESYLNRVRHGSMVELVASPIGLGNQFVFHAGLGKELHKAGDFIPAVGSPEARRLLQEGLVDEPSADSISDAIAHLNSLLTTLDDAFKGNDETEMGRIIMGLNNTIGGLNDTVNGLPDTINKTVNSITALLNSLDPIIADVNAVTGQLASADGTVGKLLNGEGPIYGSLVESLASVSGILDKLDETIAFLPSQLPQVAGLLVDVRATLANANDVMVALTNNPLLRKGIPEKVEVQSSGTSPRNIQF